MFYNITIYFFFKKNKTMLCYLLESTIIDKLFRLIVAMDDLHVQRQL